MRLITGPAGAGKTSWVMGQLRDAARAGRTGMRLLVPTSTMAQHLQNEGAREGLVFHRNLIQTLSGFVESQVTDFPQAPDSVLYLLTEEAAERVNRPEFRRVLRLPGFSAALARTIAEFSSAGCDSSRLAACLSSVGPGAPLAEAFLAVYEEVDRALDRCGLLLRAKRLEGAAARILERGASGISTVWLDGFHALPEPELAVVAALKRHAEVILTLTDDEADPAARERLLAMGCEEQRFDRKRGTAARKLVGAPGIERETEEIARRICEQAAAGRPFREMGIIVRAADTYVPLLRATLERFGIPARFYFDEDAAQHPVIRFLSGAMDAMLGGWEHEAMLAVLRLAPRFFDSLTLDRFDFAVREQIPNIGLGGLRALAGEMESPLTYLLDSLATLEEWRAFELKPPDWVIRFRTLRNLYRPARPEAATHASALLYRSNAAALDLFDEALEEAALALDPARPLGLAQYWSAVKSVLRLKPHRPADNRRNVVHVLSAHEARQWSLPVVFVCGMVENQFPQFHRPDPFFPDAARYRLNEVGIRVRTAAEFEREERALFHAALTRASMLVTLSYPEFNDRGNRNLPSLFLEGLQLDAEEARPVRPQPRHVPSPRAPAGIHAPALLTVLSDKTVKISPSGLDSYLQCPFQYFATRLLRLKPAPPRPEERLDFQQQGSIVHAVLAEWYIHPQPIAPLFDRVFAETCEECQIQPGYHTERLRNAMLQDLERFTTDSRWPRAQFETQTEHDFTFPLDDSLAISGRIDRIDTGPEGRAYIIDYKYSAAQRVKERRNGNSLQAPLYVMAAEKALGAQPAGMFFVGIKGEVEYAGWSSEGLLDADPMPEDWQAVTAERAARMVSEIRSGRIMPEPADRGSCRFCDARDICRIEVRQPAALAENA